ncbi:response regulator [Piscinibacterium candidicorallinum]|uniref:Response regulator n=1 Tax=Piscinibacterium candidicorallinum TaxID=1793872 RepID=A0ABV7GZ46_9BURK
MQVLVVEDDPKVLSYLRQGLSEEGHNVQFAQTGTNGLHLALEFEFDAVILDVMLPEIAGIEVLKRLRAVKRTPVLILSAQGSVEQRVQGLAAGADDYLVKPFAFSELVARLRAITRRQSEVPRDEQVLTCADLVVNLPAHRVTRGGNELKLTAKEFKLLVTLLSKVGEVVSRTRLAELVWDIHFDSDTNFVDVAVRRLREKVDPPLSNRLIHTVRGVGYVIEDRESK